MLPADYHLVDATLVVSRELLSLMYWWCRGQSEGQMFTASVLRTVKIP
jgi:hypothetical protein